MILHTKTDQSQAKKYTRVIPKDILSLNLTVYQRELLLLLYCIRDKNIVTYQNISMRWNNETNPMNVSPIRSQLKKYLIDLEKQKYIKRCKSKNKFTHIELNFDMFKNSENINIPCEILRDLTIDIKSLYIMVHYRIKNRFKINYWTNHSKSIGISRQTLKKYVESSDKFDSKPLLKVSSQRRIPNFFLKSRLIPKNIFKCSFNNIIAKQRQRFVDKKNKLDDFCTLLINYTNLNKNISQTVKKSGDKVSIKNLMFKNLGDETSKRLSKKKLFDYLDLKQNKFDRIVNMVKLKLNKRLNFFETETRLKEWLSDMIFEYEDSQYYSFDNDYSFVKFAANALNGKIRS